jgi:DNA-binding response OmpR family regulator
LVNAQSKDQAMKFLKKILLVDHEPKVTALVRRALEGTGNYLVKVEQDSRFALHAAPWFLPDLIMLDAAKAEAEGEDVNRQLKSEPSLKDTPFLFLSGEATPEKKVMTGGFISGYSFLATAVTLDDLIRCVEEMLNPSPAPAAKARVKASR